MYEAYGEDDAMTWSTRELAELAGTTVKTVRHYHQIGLLDEPERAANGYKHYEVGHLVRVLRIKRLGELGVPLAQIAAMGEGDPNPDDTLRMIDAELAATIKRLQLVRAELAPILNKQAPTDLPPGFGETSTELSDADRAMVLIYSRVYSAEAMDDLREMVDDANRNPIDAEFDALPADADESERQRFAEVYAPYLRELTARYPWLEQPGTHTTRGEAYTGKVVGEAITSLYNPAQIDVLVRVVALMQEDSAAEN